MIISDVSIHTRLMADGFVQIGHFAIRGSGFSYQFTHPEPPTWLHSVYAWVSLTGDGLVLRIGKCEGPLANRIAAYKRSLDDAMSGRLGSNEFFKGDTQPWEREGWIAHASAPAGGLLYAQQLAPLPGADRAIALERLERSFIKDYDPPLCGVSGAGTARKKAWVAEHGAAVAISKRSSWRAKPGSGAKAPAGPGQSPGLPPYPLDTTTPPP